MGLANVGNREGLGGIGGRGDPENRDMPNTGGGGGTEGATVELATECVEALRVDTTPADLVTEAVTGAVVLVLPLVTSSGVVVVDELTDDVDAETVVVELGEAADAVDTDTVVDDLVELSRVRVDPQLVGPIDGE